MLEACQREFAKRKIMGCSAFEKVIGLKILSAKLMLYSIFMGNRSSRAFANCAVRAGMPLLLTLGLAIY